MLQHFTRARIRATVATLLIVGSALVGTPAFATPALATAQAADAPIATASISGIVTGPDSAGRLVGLANISVSASSTNWMLTRYAVTDSTGAFTISGLSAASFTLDFRTDNSTGSYVEQ